MALPQAFLAIERTMAAAMKAEWEKRAGKFGNELQKLVDEKKWGEAQTAINGLNLDGVVSDVRHKVEEMAVSAMLFGAHHVTGSVKETTLFKTKQLPQEMHTAIDQLVHAVEKDGRDQICKQLHLTIEALKRLDDKSHVQKDDVSTAELAETGGLLEPEQAGAAPKKKRPVKKAGKALYVHRNLTNTGDFLAWAKSQGFTSTVPIKDLHVTICYSKTPVIWEYMGRAPKEVTVMEGKRAIQQFNKGAVVLEFHSDELTTRAMDLRDRGATSDFPDYRSHVTITYDAPEGLDISRVEPYRGPLIFGPEVFEEIKGAGWSPDDMEEEVLKWDRLFKSDMKLQDAINDAVRNGGTVPIDMNAGLTVSRLVSLGFLGEARQNKVTTYQVNEVLDGRTCSVCKYMHGKTFDVEQQFSRLTRALSSSDPADLRDSAPWPGQGKDDMQDLYGMSLEEMQSRGYGSPPYHPSCRGMLVCVGTVTEDIPLGGGDLATEDLSGLKFPDFGGVTPEVTEEIAEPEKPWSQDAVQALNWERFGVTDPVVQGLINTAFDAEDYDEAQKLVTAFNEHDQKTLDEAKSAAVSKDDDDDSPATSSPNEPKKKRKTPGAAGQGQEYTDIQPDILGTQFDILTSNDSNAPLDRM